VPDLLQEFSLGRQITGREKGQLVEEENIPPPVALMAPFGGI